MTEDHLAFLRRDLVVGPRHQGECDEMVAERVEHTFKPVRRQRVRMGRFLQLVLVAEVDDQVVDQGCQGWWSHEGLCHDRND